jgi:hypothetical protein
LYLNGTFNEVCKESGATLERFFSRNRDEFSVADLDVFSYAVGDQMRPLTASHALGIFILGPVDTSALVTNQPTPDAKVTGLRKTSPEWHRIRGSKVEDASPTTKYIVGECYSGENRTSIEEKVDQLEDRLSRLHRRFEDRTGARDSDVTEAVFAVLLVLRPSDCQKRNTGCSRGCFLLDVLCWWSSLRRKLPSQGLPEDKYGSERKSLESQSLWLNCSKDKDRRAQTATWRIEFLQFSYRFCSL